MFMVVPSPLRRLPTSWRPRHATVSSGASQSATTLIHCSPTKIIAIITTLTVRATRGHRRIGLRARRLLLRRQRWQHTRVEPHRNLLISQKLHKPLRNWRHWPISTIINNTVNIRQTTRRWASKNNITVRSTRPRIRQFLSSNKFALVRRLWGIITVRGARNRGQLTLRTSWWLVAQEREMAVILTRTLLRLLSTNRTVISNSRTSMSRSRVGVTWPQPQGATNSTVQVLLAAPQATSVQRHSLARLSTFRQPNRCTQPSQWTAVTAPKATILPMDVQQLLRSSLPPPLCLPSTAQSTFQIKRQWPLSIIQLIQQKARNPSSNSSICYHVRTVNSLYLPLIATIAKLRPQLSAVREVVEASIAQWL